MGSGGQSITPREGKPCLGGCLVSVWRADGGDHLWLLAIQLEIDRKPDVYGTATFMTALD